MTLTVVYDACLLYPAPLRSFLMYLAMTDLFRARWTNDIHEEWMRNVEKGYPDFTRQKAEKIRDLMNAHVRDCVVTGYEPLIASLSLPVPDDRHVLAAAIHCGADAILTFNLRDFPRDALAPYGMEAQHPDNFIASQLEVAPNIVCGAASQQRQSLKKPPMSVDQFLASLERHGLARTVSKLRQFAELIWAVRRANLIDGSTATTAGASIDTVDRWRALPFLRSRTAVAAEFVRV